MRIPKFSVEPQNRREYTLNFDRFYSRFARYYGLLLAVIPIWQKWIGQALPHLVGPQVLEISFGTGHLMTRYAGQYVVFGIDYNAEMARQAAARLGRESLPAQLQVANVERIPYASNTFDTVLSTMAFSGYPDGRQALREMRRVLRPGGKLVLVDVNFPSDGNWRGTVLAELWKATGDLIRDVPRLFREIGWRCEDREVGGYGTVHLYLAEK